MAASTRLPHATMLRGFPPPVASEPVLSFAPAVQGSQVLFHLRPCPSMVQAVAARVCGTRASIWRTSFLLMPGIAERRISPDKLSSGDFSAAAFIREALKRRLGKTFAAKLVGEVGVRVADFQFALMVNLLLWEQQKISIPRLGDMSPTDTLPGLEECSAI